MNPSHFTQVIRSRSPSPMSRHRVRSDVHRIGSETCPSDSSSYGVAPSGSRTGKTMLSIPQVGIENRPKSHSTDDHRDVQTTYLLHGNDGFAELENMASVEPNSSYQSINDGDIQDHSSDDDDAPNVQNPDSEPSVGFFSRRTIPNPRSAEPSPRIDTDRRVRRDNYRSVEESYKSWTPDQVDQLRRRVKFFFMDPWSKFKARRHIPWKMFLQFLKIIVITIQLVQFGFQRSEIVEYFERNQKALSHLLLKGWDPSYETMPYPPATGVYALYTLDDFLDHIDFAWSQYYNLSESSLATINLVKNGTGEPVPIRLCYRFNNYKDFVNGSYIVGSGVLSNCTYLTPLNVSEGHSPYDIRRFMKETNFTIHFDRMLELELRFSFNTFHLDLIDSHYGPTCYTVHAVIDYNNHERSGQILITLSNERVERVCSGKILTPAAKDEERSQTIKSIAFDAVVISVCVLSCILCTRSLLRAWKLKGKTQKLFKQRFGKELQLVDRMEFVNFWYILIICNDILTIVGGAYKIQLEARTVTITSHNYDFCSLMLGLGALTAWIGCLRYLSFFKKYNILILTLKIAFPSVLRFMVCTLGIYLGFLFSGWVILGPYHIKFRYLSTTSECLFSLVNGDDMFVTFSATQTNNPFIWYFAQIYLYIFISLFIYCVLSLFISVIMDTYERLKDGYEKGFPKTALQVFIEECDAPLKSGLYSRKHTENESRDWSIIGCLAACWRRRRYNNVEVSERTHLLTQTI